MSYRDIQKHVAELYGLEISDGAITHITELLPELKAWQQRPLEALYPCSGCSGQLKLATTVSLLGQIIKKLFHTI